MDESIIECFKSNLEFAISSTNLIADIYLERENPLIIVAILRHVTTTDEVGLDLEMSVIDTVKKTADKIGLNFLSVGHHLGRPKIVHVNDNSNRIKVTIEQDKGLALRFIEKKV